MTTQKVEILIPAVNVYSLKNIVIQGNSERNEPEVLLPYYFEICWRLNMLVT